MPSAFDNLPIHPPTDAVEKIEKFAKDKAAHKVNLIMGLYLAEDSQLWVSPLAKKVDRILADDHSLDYMYLPNFGAEAYTQAATKLLLGKKDSSQVFSVQTLGGSGALQLGLMFLTTALGRHVVYSSDPTWENYPKLFQANGFRDIRKYRYWDAENKCFDFEGMLEDLRNAPENAVIVLQACAHNPTGCDPTKEQWMKISDVIKEKKLFPFFDCAYLGYASGCFDEDAWAIRHFISMDHELFCAQSFSKNLAIYGLRTGNLVVIMNDAEKLELVRAHFQYLVRSNYLHPPCHGSRIVTKILTTPEFLDDWKECTRKRYERIVENRKALRQRLEQKSRPGMWKCVTDQRGFFTYLGLTEDAVKILIDKYHVYAPEDGRINIPSLNATNLDYFADAVIKTLEELNVNGSRCSI